VVPFFSAVNFPVRVRIALSALLAILLTPLLPAAHWSHEPWPAIVVLIAREVLTGAALGFITRTVFFAVDLAGNLITTEMGMNLAQSFNTMSGLQSQAPGMILFNLTTVLLLTCDLHHWFIVAFQRSYEILPYGAAGLHVGLLDTVVAHTGRIFTVAVLLAAPLIAVSFVITILFAVLNRAVPQMNVFAESFAFRTLGGLAVFGMTVNLMSQHIVNYLRRLPEDVLRVAQLMAGN
jgi:flagellar biosynthesis protein FliR